METKKGYIIDENSSEEDVSNFKKHILAAASGSFPKPKGYTGVEGVTEVYLDWLMLNVKAGKISKIKVNSTGYFYWYTPTGGIYDPGDIETFINPEDPLNKGFMKKFVYSNESKIVGERFTNLLENLL